MPEAGIVLAVSPDPCDSDQGADLGNEMPTVRGSRKPRDRASP